MQALDQEFQAAGYAVLPKFLSEAELKLLRQVQTAQIASVQSQYESINASELADLVAAGM